MWDSPAGTAGVLGNMTSANGYLVALAVMGGLEQGENLTDGTNNMGNAVTFN